jgi:hypothetical protein
MRSLRERLTYANVMATVAVFGVLGGGSYAASTAKKNSVTTKSVKNASLGGIDVRNDSLTGDDINEASLSGGLGTKGDPGSPGEAAAFTTLKSTGVVVPERSKGITQADVDPDTVVGTYCFTLPATPKSAMVSPQGVFDGGEQDVIVSVYVSDSPVSSGDCGGNVLVRTFDFSSNALADRAFHIWFEK